MYNKNSLNKISQTKLESPKLKGFTMDVKSELMFIGNNTLGGQVHLDLRAPLTS